MATPNQKLMWDFPALPETVFMVEEGEVIAIALGVEGYYPQPNLSGGYDAESTAEKFNSVFITQLISDYPDLMDRIKSAYKMCSMFGWLSPAQQKKLTELHKDCLAQVSR